VRPAGITPEQPAEPRIVGAIPSRYGSQRLPGKALADLGGRPLIEHVYRRAVEAKRLGAVIVLTDDRRIADAVAAFGGQFEMTPVDCVSGTDRIAWAARNWDVDAVVNIQGDEPLIDAAAIDSVAEHLANHPADPVVTLAAPGEPQDADDPDVVKVVLDRAGYALYFSRAPIPYPRRQGGPLWRHQGIYGYQRDALLQIAALPPTPLEVAESLEQLRMLEHGYRLRVLEWEQAFPGVDTANDLERVRTLLANGSADDPTTPGRTAGETP
jgi:3-deoxy-manno-octulosonate cytidylyltransferase (CMP-KDO synthetase)